LKKDTCYKIESLVYPVYVGTELNQEMGYVLQSFFTTGRIFILADIHTHRYCLPVLAKYLPGMAQQPVFSVLPGEQSKNPAILESIWKWLLEAGADRESILINLGGGVISDLGGFAAASFKRGIRYINIPTSLIGQADAAIGGKTGINVAGIKNQAGCFYDPVAVFIMTEFLKTLPEDHLRSGYAEIIKCAVLSGNSYWEKVKNGSIHDHEQLFSLVHDTAGFKARTVADDPYDYSLRKILNFGHTIGHALESLSGMKDEEFMLHGEAVAAGMICESYLSYNTAGLSKDGLEEITDMIKSAFNLKPVETYSFNHLLKLMEHDKKKTTNGIGFTLLENLGHPLIDRTVDHKDIIASLEYLNQVSQT